MEEKIRNAMKFYLLATKLKYKIRSAWDANHWNINSERLESVAEHVYGTCILAISLSSEFDFEIDLNKVLKMLVIHEIGEVLIGDITPFDNITPEEKQKTEFQAVSLLINDLSTKEELLGLFVEFEERLTNEAKFAYYIDKLEANIQAKVYQDNGFQRSLDDQKNNIVFNSSKVQEMLANGAQSAFDIWYEYDKNKFEKEPIFQRTLNFIKDNDVQI